MAFWCARRDAAAAGGPPSGPFGPDEVDALDVLPTTPVPALAVWGLIVVAGLFLGLAVWMTARPPLPGTAAPGA